MNKVPCREGHCPQIGDVSVGVLELCLRISAGSRAVPACSLAFATQEKKKINQGLCEKKAQMNKRPR